MGKHFAFDMHLAIKTAWDMLWAANLVRRKENDAYKKKYGKRSYDDASTYYLCAADLVRTVRGFAQQTADGKPWSLDGYPYNVRLRGDVQRAVRDWLMYGNGGKIVGHNFGRGHISGMRFRPAGAPMAEAEVETMNSKLRSRGKEKPRHYGHRPLCTKNRRSPFSRPGRTIWSTTNKDNVTCPRCLKLMKVETGE